MITAAQLTKLEPKINPAIAASLATELTVQFPNWGIGTPLETAHFIAQAAYETEGFSRFEENLNYIHATAITAAWSRLAARAADLIGKPQALGNAAYAYHNGNGDEASNDGWTFRGRGIFMLTGRENYLRAGTALDANYIESPDLVAQPYGACRTALWYWKGRNLSHIADTDNCDAITRIINGGMNGAFARRQLVEAAKNILLTS